jgi:hypothetical protein
VSGYWTCRRQAKGKKCGWSNPNRNRKCLRCGKPRPQKVRPAHMAALELPYDKFVKLNGGEFCAICGKGPGKRKLDRDHCHTTGRPRGLLCHRHNRGLDWFAGPDELRAAAAYLERAERAA